MAQKFLREASGSLHIRGSTMTFSRAHACAVSPQQCALATIFPFHLFPDSRLSVPMIIAIELQFRMKRVRLFIAGLHWCSLPSHVRDSFAVPCHRMPPDAAAERACEAAAGREEAARRSPEGREQAARRPAAKGSMVARKPMKVRDKSAGKPPQGFEMAIVRWFKIFPTGNFSFSLLRKLSGPLKQCRFA